MKDNGFLKIIINLHKNLILSLSKPRTKRFISKTIEFSLGNLSLVTWIEER